MRGRDSRGLPRNLLQRDPSHTKCRAAVPGHSAWLEVVNAQGLVPVRGGAQNHCVILKTKEAADFLRSRDAYPRADGLSEGRQLREWDGLGKARAGGEILLPFMFGTRGKTNSPSLPVTSTG